MKRLVLDIETDKDVTKIHLVVTLDIYTKELQCHTDVSSLAPLIEHCGRVIAHNGIKFDFYHLQRLWKLSIPTQKQRDTLILSRLYRPDIAGGHSLDAWGRRLSFPKTDYIKAYLSKYPQRTSDDAWNNPDIALLKSYCKQDVKVTAKLVDYLASEFKRLKFSDKSIELEHQVAHIVFQQELDGFMVDERKLMLLNASLQQEKDAIETQLQSTFPPAIVEMKTKTKEIPFNPGSRKQIAERLIEKGWKPSQHTEKGNIIVDESVLETIDMPEAKLLSRYFMLEKRLGQTAQWIKHIGNDGRIHGSVITNGAVTGRMTHSSPNMAQVPAIDKEYGPECRELFCVPKGSKLVGIDASGLELRMLAHYMDDPEYTREVVEGDVHTKNQLAAGLPSRNNAKTFISVG